jgi:hypothetical protein
MTQPLQYFQRRRDTYINWSAETAFLTAGLIVVHRIMLQLKQL